MRHCKLVRFSLPPQSNTCGQGQEPTRRAESCDRLCVGKLGPCSQISDQGRSVWVPQMHQLTCHHKSFVAHILRLPLRRLKRHYVTNTHCYPHCCCSVVLSTCHFVNLPLCQLNILSNCHFVNLPLCQLNILSNCHFVNLLLYQLAIQPTQYFANLPFC